MRTLNTAFLLAIVLLFAAASLSASARGGKSGPGPSNHAATIKHDNQPTSTARKNTKGKGNSKPSVSDIVVTKPVDKSSP